MGTKGTRPVRLQYGRECPLGGNICGSASCLGCAHLRGSDAGGRTVLCDARRPQFSERLMQDRLDTSFLSNPKYLLHNLNVFGWESDWLAVTRAGMWHEAEIKVSMQDLRRDFVAKGRKHRTLAGEGGMPPPRPNTFTYAVPDAMADEALPLIPEYAGLVGVPLYGRHLRTLRPAPYLTKDKWTAAELGLTDKFYWNYTDYRAKYLAFGEEKERLKAEIAFLKAEFEAMTGVSWKDHLGDISETLD